METVSRTVGPGVSASGASEWALLLGELDAWRDADRVATLWWRDDDAVADTPALRRMLSLAAGESVPLGLAVTPRAVTGSLAPLVADLSFVFILQHGYAHTNHEPEGRKKAEFGPSRTLAESEAEITQGWWWIQERFVDRALPVLVPPWNRIDGTIASRLSGCFGGPCGLSTYKPRSVPTMNDITICNTHVDPIAWRSGRGFVGIADTVTQMVAHLRARRLGSVDPSEATGLLTHHLVEPPACTDFLRDLIQVVRDHPAACWVEPPYLFDRGRPE